MASPPTAWRRHCEDHGAPVYTSSPDRCAAAKRRPLTPCLPCARPGCRNNLAGAVNQQVLLKTPPKQERPICVSIPSVSNALFFLPKSFTADGIKAGLHPVEAVLQAILDSTESEVDIAVDRSVYALTGRYSAASGLPGGDEFRISTAAHLAQFLEADPPTDHVVRLVVSTRRPARDV